MHRIKTIFIICALLMTVFPSYSSATPADDKRAEKETAEEQVEGVSAELEAAVTRHNAAQDELEKTEEAIKNKIEELAQCEQELNRAKDIFNERAKGMYKYGQVDLLEVIFGSRSVSELTELFNLINRIGESDVDLIHQMTSSKQELEIAKAELSQAQAQQAALVAQIEQERNTVEARLAEKRELVESIEGDIARLETESDNDLAPIQSIVRGNPGAAHGGVVGIAASMIGVPYVYGGTTPSGFDCSGLVWYCYGRLGIYLNRTCDYPPNLGWDELRPGDLVYSHGGAHVGIYSGGGMQIHAPYPGRYVCESPVYGFCGGYRP